MKDSTQSEEVATPFKMAAIAMFTLALLLSSCEQPEPPRVVKRVEGCKLLGDIGLRIGEIRSDRVVTLRKGDALLKYDTLIGKPFVLEGSAQIGDEVVMGHRYTDVLYENGQVRRIFKYTAVASKSDEGWQKYFADAEEEKPLEKNK